MNTTSPPRPDKRQARGGLVDLDNVQGVLADLRRGDRTSLRRVVLVVVVVVAGLVPAVIAGLYALDRVTSWEQYAAGQVAGAAWVAEVRADGAGRDLRVRVEGEGSAAGTLEAPAPGNSVRALWLQVGEHAFVAGRAAGHVDAVRLDGAGGALAAAEERSPTGAASGGRWLFAVPAGTATPGTEVEGLGADGEVLGAWRPDVP